MKSDVDTLLETRQSHTAYGKQEQAGLFMEDIGQAGERAKRQKNIAIRISHQETF